MLVQSGNGVAATPLYERALGIWEKALGPDHPKVATALVNLAGVYSNRGNYDGARPLVIRALATQQKHLGPEHPDTAHTLTRLAELAARTGLTGEAFEAAADAEGLWREHVRLTARTLSERQALAYATSATSALDVMSSIAAARPADRETSSRIWDALIQSRGIVLDEMAARHRTANTTENPEVVALSTTLASARQRLAALFIRGIRNDSPERYRRLLDRARDEKDSAERELAEKSDRFRDDQAKSQIGVADLSASLPRDTALVAFARYRHYDDSPAVGGELSYLAFVLRGGDSAPALLPLGTAAAIEPLITQWQRQINGEAFAAGRATARGEAAYRRVAEELRSRVWDPLLPYLSTATRVFIVPDGALHLVSFAALPTAPSRYLVETGPVIHYLSTERDLIDEGDPGSRANGLLAIGNPAFDESAVSPRVEQVFRGSRSACIDFQSMRFDQLPASANEVNAVVTLWNRTKRNTVRLTGTGATEGAFKAQAAGHRVLHLATHGFFLGGRCVPPSDTATPSRIGTDRPREPIAALRIDFGRGKSAPCHSTRPGGRRAHRRRSRRAESDRRRVGSAFRMRYRRGRDPRRRGCLRFAAGVSPRRCEDGDHEPLAGGRPDNATMDVGALRKPIHKKPQLSRCRPPGKPLRAAPSAHEGRQHAPLLLGRFRGGWRLALTP